MALARRDNLRNHRAVQHFGVRFICLICEHVEKWSDKLRNHLREFHSFTDDFEDGMCRRIFPELATHPPDEKESNTQIHTAGSIHSVEEVKAEVMDTISIITDEDSDNNDDDDGQSSTTIFLCLIAKSYFSL